MNKDEKKRNILMAVFAFLLFGFFVFSLFYIKDQGMKVQKAEENRIALVKKETEKYGDLQAKKHVTKQEFLKAFNVANKHNNKELLNKINGLEIYDPKTKRHYITHTDYRKDNSNYSLMPID